ncbi:MAG: DNA polymerase-3 subunit epsilon [Zhongshania aliphaticivorans]|uniref:3'-5' exonuclease n=1 Tax=Zhongshania aliphaticivorans TaxID=1470434 RepID=UPI0039E51430
MFYLAKNQLSGQAQAMPQGKRLDWSSRFAFLAEASKHPSLKAFYQHGVVAASTPIADVSLVALDFETTGLDPRRDSIVSIGLVPMTISRIRCNGARHWVIKPETRLHSSSVMIHGITHSVVEDAPEFSTVIDTLLGHLQGKTVVVHYSAIERRFLHAALMRHIQEGIEFPVIDTMEIEARYTRTWRQSLWNGLMGRQPSSIRLTDSRTRYHLPYYRQHHALTDALACGELLQAQCATHFTPSTPLSALWS